MHSSTLRLCGALLAAALATVCAADQQAFFARPDIHGDLVVFTAEGDLWLGHISTGQAQRITSDPGLETKAHFSPDGTMIAFTANYEKSTDTYVMPVAGGPPKRLTYDPVSAGVIGWSADGKSVLFRSGRKFSPGGQRQLFSVSVNGGLPKQLPVVEGEFAAMSPDGKTLAYVPGSNEWMNWFRYKGGEADDIWITDFTGRNFTKLTDNLGVDTTPSWLGNHIVYASEQGSNLANLCEIDPATRRTTMLTSFNDDPVRYPSSDGKRVVFQKGPGIYLYDPATGARELKFELNSDRLHARDQRLPVSTWMRSASVGPSGKRIVIEARGQLVSVAATNGDARVIESDSSGRAMHPSWSPDGKTIAYISDKGGEEQIYLVPAAGGPSKKLTSDLKGQHFEIVWSPDGKSLAVGDREMRIQVVDVATGAVKLVDQADRSQSYDNVNSDYTFSPDSKWIAFSRQESTWNKGIHLVELATGKRLDVSDPTVNSFEVTFDPAGKYLFFLQDREVNPVGSQIVPVLGLDDATKVTALVLASDTPSPFAPKNDEEGEKAKEEPKANGVTKIDPAGLTSRMVDVPIPAGRYTTLLATGSKLILLNAIGAQGLDGPADTELSTFDLATKKLTSLGNSITGAELSSDHSKLMVIRAKSVLVCDAGAEALTGTVDLSGVTVTVNPVAEWREALEEAWRVGRDFFYDPNMHGVDWNAVRRKYEAKLPLVGDRSDLTRVIGDMISELNVGHAYVSGRTGYDIAPQPMGYLGVDLELDASGKAYRITKLLQGDPFDLVNRSPFLEPGLNVKVGDFILEIGGQPVRADQDPQAMLIGMQGHQITVKVSSNASGTGARIVRVVPKASEATMRYEDWVESRREYVRKASNGQIGYAHMSDMGTTGYTGYAKGYFAATEKAGLIFDDRFNGGGFVAANVLSQLSAKPLGFFKPRYGISWVREGWAPFGKVVGLTNEWAFSDGEYFAEMFKRMKVGTLVGTRTGGGEVGSGGGYELVDGGQVWIPNYGCWTADGKWIVEGTGVTPDVVIEQDPALIMQGKDPQLDKAIAILMDWLKAHPYVRPTPPPFPVKVRKAGG